MQNIGATEFVETKKGISAIPMHHPYGFRHKFTVAFSHEVNIH